VLEVLIKTGLKVEKRTGTLVSIILGDQCKISNFFDLKMKFCSIKKQKCCEILNQNLIW
jgi:hypothetical protein